jgi:3-methyladenine DNA glycosylase/8-oxoguanine DNA glycosylase
MGGEAVGHPRIEAGPQSAKHIAMRAMDRPHVFLETDIVIKRPYNPMLSKKMVRMAWHRSRGAVVQP